MKEKYPYTYEDNRTLIDEILRDPGSVQSRIEKLLLSLTNSTSLFDVHMAMKQDYDGFAGILAFSSKKRRMISSNKERRTVWI